MGSNNVLLLFVTLVGFSITFFKLKSIIVSINLLLFKDIRSELRKDRTNSGGALLIYSKEDIGICRKHELENDIDETIWDLFL
jgi:hypothetical protein